MAVVSGSQLLATWADLNAQARIAERALIRKLFKKFHNPNDPIPMQAVLLACLREYPGSSEQRLIDLTGIDRSTVHVALEMLGPTRRQLISFEGSLTPLGERVAQRVVDAVGPFKAKEPA